MKYVIAALCLLWYGCAGGPAEEYPPEHTDTVGITVPEDAVPEHIKPGKTDSLDSLR